jgi:hypothetical protein
MQPRSNDTGGWEERRNAREGKMHSGSFGIAFVGEQAFSVILRQREEAQSSAVAS